MTIDEWTNHIAEQPDDAEAYFERGRLYYQQQQFGLALNDFSKTLSLKPDHTSARQMKDMTEAIFNFRNFDLYNP